MTLIAYRGRCPTCGRDDGHDPFATPAAQPAYDGRHRYVQSKEHGGCSECGYYEWEPWHRDQGAAATIYGVGNTDATWREFEIDARAALTASGLLAEVERLKGELADLRGSARLLAVDRAEYRIAADKAEAELAGLRARVIEAHTGENAEGCGMTCAEIDRLLIDAPKDALDGK